MALNQNAAYALRYLQEKYKLSPVQAAGVVGNLYGESGLNTGAINHGDGNDGSNSIGIAQWNGQRAKNLRAFGGDNYNNLDTQLDFVMHEMNGEGGNGGGSESAAYKRLMNADNVADATSAFIGYERPQGWSADNPTAGHNYKGRLGYAGQVLGMSPDEIAAATPTSAPSAPASAGAQNTATAAVEPPKDSAPWSVGKDVKLPKFLPDKLFGMDTKKGLSGFGSMMEAFAKNDQAMNQQVQQTAQAAQGRRAQNQQVEQSFAATPLIASAGSAGPAAQGMDPVQLELLKKKLRGRSGGLGGLGGIGRA